MSWRRNRRRQKRNREQSRQERCDHVDAEFLEKLVGARATDEKTGELPSGKFEHGEVYRVMRERDRSNNRLLVEKFVKFFTEEEYVMAQHIAAGPLAAKTPGGWYKRQKQAKETVSS